MSSILRWLGTSSWPLSQQCTIFSETRKTSSVFAIYVMVAFVIILGSLHVPRTAGHKLEEHWKDTAHRKKLPTISPYEQRRSRGLHSTSRTFQKENDRISPNRSTTNVKKRGRADKSPLHHTKDRRTTTSWLHPKGEDLGPSSARNQNVKLPGVVNAARSSTSDYGSRKWQTVNTQHFRLRVEKTSVAVPFRSTSRQPLGPIQINPVVVGANLSDPVENQVGGDHESTSKNQHTIRNFADKLTESHDAVTTGSFSPQMPDKGLPVTKRKSTERKAMRASFWQSRDTSKATASTFYPRSIVTSAPVTNRKEMHLEENRQVTDNIQKSVRSRPTISPGQEKDISHAFQLGSSPELDRVEPDRNTFPVYASNARSKVSPMQQITSKILSTSNLGTTIVKVTSNKPVIDPHSPGKPILPPNTGKLKDKSSEISTRNIEIISAHQDSIINSLKSSWSPFPSKLSTKSHSFQNSHMTNTLTPAVLTLSTKLNPQIDLSSHVRNADEPIVPTVDQKGSSLTPISMDTRLSTTNDNILPFDKKNNMSNAGTSSPAPMTSTTTQTERKRRRRKKGKNKRRRQRKKKTGNKKLSSNPQRVSAGKDMSPNTEQMSTTQNEAVDADALFEDQNEQRLTTSSKSANDSTGEPSIDINTPLMEFKTSRPWQKPHDQQRLDRRLVSAAVDSDWLDKMNYSEVTEGSVEDGLTLLGESQSESHVLGSDSKQKRLDTTSNIQISEDMRRLFKTGLPPDDHSEPDLPSQTNMSPSVLRFIPKRRKGSVRDRNTKNNFFQKTKVPIFESSESSGRDTIIKDFSRLHFAKMATVLKTTVKRSVRPVEAITPTPNKKKSVVDSKRRKFQLRKQKNKTNDRHIPNRETQSSSDSDSVKQVVSHSKSHSLFDHDEAAGSKHMKAQTMAEPNKQTTDSASALYPFIEENLHTLKSKTSSLLSEIQPVSSKMFSAISSPSIRNVPGWHRSTQIGSYERKDSLHATTAVYERLSSETSTSLPFAYDKMNTDEKKVGLLVTQPSYSIINDTTQVSAHFSSRIIRGIDGSKSSQTLPATASSDRDRDATGKTGVYRKRKTDSSIKKDLNIQLPSTYASGISPVHSQTTKSSTQPLTEITPVQFTQQSTGSRVPYQRSSITSKFTQHVTISSRQTDNPSDNTHVQNGFLIDGESSSSPSTSITKDSSDLFTLHKEHRQTNEMMSNEGFVKEWSTSTSTRQEPGDTFRETSSDSGAIGFGTSNPLSAIWTLSTPRSRSNKQSSEKHSTNRRLPSTESPTAESAVPIHNSNLETSRLFVTSAKASDPDNKITPPRAISHDDQHYFLHPTTLSPSSFLTSSTSKSPLSLSSITKSVNTQSTPAFPAAKSSPFVPSSSNDIHKMITTSSVHVTPDTSISTLQVSSVSKERHDNQHQSTTKPLTKRPHSTKNKPSKIPSTTFTMSSTTKTTAATRRILIAPSEKTSKGTNATTRKPFKANHTPTSTFMTENFGPTPGRKSTKNKGASETTLSNNIITNTDELVSTPDSAYTVSLKPKNDQPKSPLPPDSPDEELLVKCKVKSNINVNGNDFINNIKNGLVNSYLEGRNILNERKAGSTNKRRKRETIGYVLEPKIDTHAVHYVETEGIEAKVLRLSRRGQLVEIYFQMLEYGLVIATDTAIKVFSQLQITEISVNLHYPIYHQIEAIKNVMFQSQHPLKPSATKWMMVTIAAPSIPVLCVICILLTSWYRNHARLRRKAMAEISRGSQYAESLADVGLEIDMEKGEIVSRAGSTSVLWTDFAAGDTLERMDMAGDFPNTDGESMRSNSWNARGDSRTCANPSVRGRRQSPVARQCQRSGKYVKKKDSVSSFHFENNLEDECPPVYESFEPALSNVGQWPRTSTLQSRTTSGRHQQRKDNLSTSQIYGDSVLISSQKLRPTLHANIISHFLAELDTM